MKITIYCKPTDKGIHSFFVKVNDLEFFLFSQKYRVGVHKHFSKGVSLKEAFDFSNIHKDAAIEKTMDKLPMYIKYIEKEYNVSIFNQTKKKLNKKFKKCYA